jgi:hypothetical protein
VRQRVTLEGERLTGDRHWGLLAVMHAISRLWRLRRTPKRRPITLRAMREALGYQRGVGKHPVSGTGYPGERHTLAGHRQQGPL